MEKFKIREGLPRDLGLIEQLYAQAFPDEDLLPLVRELLDSRSDVISLVATDGSAVIGHIVFTDCRYQHGEAQVSLLGPLAVLPDRQHQGVGSTLIESGVTRLRDAGATWLYVLGDPNYYGRFGFVSEHGIEPPYPLPEEWSGAWQSLRLTNDAQASSGKLVVPEVWQHLDLWAP